VATIHADVGRGRNLDFFATNGARYRVDVTSLLTTAWSATAIPSADCIATLRLTAVRASQVKTTCLKFRSAGLLDFPRGSFNSRSLAHKKCQRGESQNERNKFMHGAPPVGSGLTITHDNLAHEMVKAEASASWGTLARELPSTAPNISTFETLVVSEKNPRRGRLVALSSRKVRLTQAWSASLAASRDGRLPVPAYDGVNYWCSGP
jgi:hypothetical protein